MESKETEPAKPVKVYQAGYGFDENVIADEEGNDLLPEGNPPKEYVEKGHVDLVLKKDFDALKQEYAKHSYELGLLHGKTLDELRLYKAQADALAGTLAEVRKLARELGKSGMDFLANTNLGERVDITLGNYAYFKEHTV